MQDLESAGWLLANNLKLRHRLGLIRILKSIKELLQILTLQFIELVNETLSAQKNYLCGFLSIVVKNTTTQESGVKS